MLKPSYFKKKNKIKKIKVIAAKINRYFGGGATGAVEEQEPSSQPCPELEIEKKMKTRRSQWRLMMVLKQLHQINLLF